MGFDNKIVAETLPNAARIEQDAQLSTKQLSTVSKSESTQEVPLSAYNEIKKIPYTAEYFKLNFFKELDDKNDVHGLRDKVKSIEKFVKTEIEHRKLSDSISSYKNIIDGILDFVGKSDKGEKQLTRVAEYAKLVQKKRDFDDKYNKLISKMGLLNGQYQDIRH